MQPGSRRSSHRDRGRGHRTGHPRIRPRASLRAFLSPHRHDRGGSGLGLPIAREIVHCHGGHITLASGAHGDGTVVRVSLPASNDRGR
ncbi:ATP-binding protein [Thauera humireducens]|uniref:ATP-binding protein n=1 Tax=Thauera humireducens TaxID=1134435 RepID=UPI003C77BCE7